MMTRFFRYTPASWLACAALAGFLVLSGCDDESLVDVDGADAGAQFDTYVSLGNSITAGFQSSGISASTQMESYAVLLGQQMGTEFNAPLLKEPGCPPPLAAIFPAPVSSAPSVDCAFRETPAPEVIHNVAVPGAKVIDLTDNLSDASSANALTTFILGGRTQVEAALDAQPTFASVWIGNNDVLGAALAGDPARITPQGTFTRDYDAIMDGLTTSATGGLLIGVVQVTFAPNLSAGAAYLQAIPAAQQAGAAPPNLAVAPSCAPSANGGVGDQVLIPFQYGAAVLNVAGMLAEQLGADAPTLTFDCSGDRTVGDVVLDAFGRPDPVPENVQLIILGLGSTANTSVLSGAEIVQVSEAVAGYNAYIAAEADARGWAYLDPNVLLQANRAQIPLFPELFEIPGNAFTASEPFGPLFSLDGVHPSAEAHRLIADAAIDAINAKYGTSIPKL